MIGQHIYSRCLEGYFSKSGLNADSTTVTISMNMFARVEQAKLVAKECEKISTLEDIRPVPQEIQGAYRGVLKIRRLNQQITVVCRSYRLHSTGSGESRDFTYGSSYILAGDDKEHFLESPEYVLNIQDFEAYPSVMQRIQESRMQGNGGKIEANEEYSLFRSNALEISTDIFQKAGFTKELFVEYISSIIQRVSLSHYSGHENDKVLIILPRAYNQGWERSGGNAYAEEILVATMKLLPTCVEEQLNATTGGREDPTAPVLDGYQLVFMEPCNTKNWKLSEYSVIDLDQQESWISKDLDTSYGEFLWNYLNAPEVREKFEKEYESLFNEGKSEEQDQAPEKFSFLLDLHCQETDGFADIHKRHRLLFDLLDYNEEGWTEKSTYVAAEILKLEIREPQYETRLENALLELAEQETCPSELKPFIVTVLLQNILNGNGREESIQWICREIQNDMVVSKLREANQYVLQNEDSIIWYEKKSLLKLYMEICKNSELGADEGVKSEILSILTDWHIQLFIKGDWQNCATIMSILAAQLENPELREENRKEIYENLLDVLLSGEKESEKQISDILKQEERKFTVYPRNLKLFRECFEKKVREDGISIGDEIIWQLTYLAVSGDEVYLHEHWRPLHKDLVVKYRNTYKREIFEEIYKDFRGWISNSDEKKLPLICSAVAVTEANNLLYGYPEYCPTMQKLRSIMKFLENNGRYQSATNLLYRRYSVLEEMEQKKSFFINELNREEQWMLLFSNEFSDNKDELLSKVKEEFAGMRKEFFSVAKKLELIDKEQLKKTADIYFELCEKYIRENNKNADALDAWCWVCRNEIHEIETISKNISFNAYVIKLFRQRMAATSQESAEALSIGDILFLKEKKILPLGANWGFLDVVGTLYDADPNYQSEEFLQIRNKIVLEHNDIIKKIYLSALTEKREMLLRDNIKKEITYNVALLEEQIRQDLKGTERSVLESVTMAVWRTRIEKEKILTAFQLLEIILCYGNQKDYGVYDGEYVKESILRELFAIAQNKIEVFEDKQLVNEYRKLNRTNKILMEQSGIMQCLQELPKEWQQDYAVRSERNKSGWLLTGILSGVFVLAGIAAEVLFFIFYNHIDINIAVLTGILLSAAGIVGAIVVLICMLISLNR